jgi:ElaA protein
MNFIIKHFNELNTIELYNILQARALVFSVEQQCAYNDLDNLDFDSYHVYALNENERLLAYTRLLPKGVAYKDYCSIGRVLTTSLGRGTGIGKQLVQFSINQCNMLFLNTPIKIGAQLYLKKFYEGFGFRIISEVYLEDNIEHIHMVLSV